MAERKTLARPYAKALFAIAKEHNAFDQWSSILKLLAGIAENKEANLLFLDRTLPASDLADFVFEVGGKYLNKDAKNFIELLAANRRLNILPEIFALYEQYRNDAENTIDVEVSTVIPVNEKEVESFNRYLKTRLAKKLKLSFKIDKSLLGGFVARAGNYVIDHSLKSSLTALKTTLGG